MLNDTESDCRLRHTHVAAAILTHAYPGGDVSPGAQVGDEYDGAHIADLVHGGDDARDARRDLVALLDGRDDRIEVTGAQRLLQCHQQRQQEDEDLKEASAYVGSLAQNSEFGKILLIHLSMFQSIGSLIDMVLCHNL